jgi:hypothetical protein
MGKRKKISDEENGIHLSKYVKRSLAKKNSNVDTGEMQDNEEIMKFSEQTAYIQYLPEVWKRAREASVKSRFSPRSQKSGFSRRVLKFFLKVAIMVCYFLNFFQIFITRGRASTNGCKRLETRCRSVVKSGYFAAL